MGKEGNNNYIGRCHQNILFFYFAFFVVVVIVERSMNMFIGREERPKC